MNVAIIPARGGSKRIPRKNIKDFCGKPMLAWAAGAARASGCFGRIIMSTDDPEIADVAQSWGVECPFLRPAALADDHVGVTTVMRHAVTWLRDSGVAVENACCIYATAPFVTAEDLCRGKQALTAGEADYAISVTSFPFPIQRAVRLTGEGGMAMFYPEHRNTRSQDLEEAYHDAGQFCWGTAAAWMADKALFGPETVPVILPRHRVQDIDTPEDWERAEWLFQALFAQGAPR